MKTASIAFLVAAQLATAHFGLEYPEWRVDTLKGEEKYSQWVWPCKFQLLPVITSTTQFANRLLSSGAGVPGNLPDGNRTDWPLDGGSLKLELHHAWTYVFVNLGLGDNVTVFNYTLTPSLVNTTGNGTLCIPKLPLPANLKVADGDQASIQVVTSGESGSALYNVGLFAFSLLCSSETLTMSN